MVCRASPKWRAAITPTNCRAVNPSPCLLSRHGAWNGSVWIGNQRMACADFKVARLAGARRANAHSQGAPGRLGHEGNLRSCLWLRADDGHVGRDCRAGNRLRAATVGESVLSHVVRAHAHSRTHCRRVDCVCGERKRTEASLTSVSLKACGRCRPGFENSLWRSACSAQATSRIRC